MLFLLLSFICGWISLCIDELSVPDATRRNLLGEVPLLSESAALIKSTNLTINSRDKTTSTTPSPAPGPAPGPTPGCDMGRGTHPGCAPPKDHGGPAGECETNCDLKKGHYDYCPFPGHGGPPVCQCLPCFQPPCRGTYCGG